MTNYDSNYNTMTFSNVWSRYEDFYNDYVDLGYEEVMSSDSFKKLFRQLTGEFANSSIINSDVNQFRIRVFNIVEQFGAEWAKKLELQKRIIALTEDEILEGGKAIINHALNPSTEDKTEEELNFISEQSVSKRRRSLIEALNVQWESINSNITEDFISKFRHLFSKFVEREINPIYNK